MTIKLSRKVVDFVRSQAPEPRHQLRLALRFLVRGRGDVKALEGQLAGYERLRVGPYRVIFRRRPTTIECIFAERRSIIYEVFAEQMRQKLLDK
jgi:mRNA-degrading endonuclease RelE of RelBE toxin-antitoxin system